MSGEKKYQQEEQLFRYLKNEMTEKERNVFEREIQKDPFLAEAVDGLSSRNSDQVIADVNDLKGMLQKGHRRRRQLWWYAAASILIVVASGLWLLNMEKEVKQEISQSKIEISPVVKEPVEKQQAQKELLTPALSNVLQDSMKSKEDHQVMVSEVRKAPIDVTNVEGKKKKPTIMIRGASQIRNHYPTILNVVDTTKLLIRKAVDSSPSKKTAVNQFSMNAAGAQTESSITFLHDSIEKPTAFSKVDSGKNSTLGEVVVIGYPHVQKQQHLLGAVSSVVVARNAAPVIGWKRYQKYLDEACDNPMIGIPQKRTVVKLKFTVNRTGQLENFKVVRSTNKKYNQEAIRIVQQGPSWHTKVKKSISRRKAIKLRLVFEPGK